MQILILKLKMSGSVKNETLLLEVLTFLHSGNMEGNCELYSLKGPSGSYSVNSDLLVRTSSADSVMLKILVMGKEEARFIYM